MKMKNPTLADAKRLLIKSNPDVKNSLLVSWIKKPHRLNNGDYRWVQGWVKVTAEGFRTRRMIISRDADSLMIR